MPSISAHVVTATLGCPAGRSPTAHPCSRGDSLRRLSGRGKRENPHHLRPRQVGGAMRLLFPLGVLICFTLPLSAAPEKHLSIYSTVANYSLPIVQRQGRDYIGLLELLDPLGTVSAKSDGLHWRLHYNNILGEFTVGKNHARIQGRDADLSAKFLMENGRGLVPLTSLNSLLPRFLGGPANLHEE